MNVVFVNPPIRLPEVFAHYPMFSTLGLLYNAAWTRVCGHETRVVDAFTLSPRLHLRQDGKGVRHVGAEVGELADTVAAVAGQLEGPAAVVVSMTMFSEMNRLNENLVKPVVEAIRARLPGVSLGLADLYTCGMNYFPYDPRKVLQAIAGADWLLVGEGEPTLPALLDRLSRGESLAGMPRLAHRQGSQIVFEDRPPAPVDDLDTLPPPAFDLLDMERFFRVQADAIAEDLVHEYHVPERQLPLMTSRSCPFRCNFCTNQVLGLPWRAHSVGYLRKTIGELRDRYRVDRFLFLDDNINVDARRFRELVVAMASERIPWDAVNGYRADRLDRETIQAIKDAGNTKLTVSAESGDPELLNKVIQKGIKLSAIIDAARLCDELGIPLQVHYIVGVPGETKTQINKTLEFATMLFELHGAWPLLQHAIPFPGTRLFHDCADRGYFVADPYTIPGELLEVESIIRTPEFQPGEVIRMKRNAQHLHASMQSLTMIGPDSAREQVTAQLRRARFLGGREVFFQGASERLPGLLREAKSLGFERAVLVTDGAGLAAPGLARELAFGGLDSLVVELNGPDAATHDAVTTKKGSFAVAVAGLREAAKAGIKEFDIQVRVARANLSRLAETVALARTLRARSVHLQYPSPDSRSDGVPTLDEARGELLRAVRSAPRGYATIQGVPLCYLPEQPGAIRPSPPWELKRARPFKTKTRECLECVGYILCPGKPATRD